MFLKINEQGIDHDLLTIVTTLSAQGFEVTEVVNGTSNFYGKDDEGPQRRITISFASMAEVFNLYEHFGNDEDEDYQITPDALSESYTEADQWCDKHHDGDDGVTDAIYESMSYILPKASLDLFPGRCWPTSVRYDKHKPGGGLPPRIVDIYPDGDDEDNMPAWQGDAIESLRKLRGKTTTFGPTLVALSVMHAVSDNDTWIDVSKVKVRPSKSTLLRMRVRVRGKRTDTIFTVSHQGALSSESTTKKRVSAEHFTAQDMMDYLAREVAS